MKMKMDLEMGLPEGIPAQEGAPEKFPIQMEMTTTLVEVK